MTPEAIHDHIAVLTLWREARGESWEGILAAAWAIRNRMSDPRWADTAGGVTLQRLQFSCWNPRDPNRVKFPEPGDPKLAECEAAWIMSSGIGTDITNGANHYHSTAVSPKWAAADKLTASIDHHKFYKL